MFTRFQIIFIDEERVVMCRNGSCIVLYPVVDSIRKHRPFQSDPASVDQNRSYQHQFLLKSQET
jgi:hypothetical protein